MGDRLLESSSSLPETGVATRSNSRSSGSSIHPSIPQQGKGSSCKERSKWRVVHAQSGKGNPSPTSPPTDDYAQQLWVGMVCHGWIGNCWSNWRERSKHSGRAHMRSWPGNSVEAKFGCLGVRKAKEKLELNLPRDPKINQKGFYRFISQKRKVKEGLTPQ